MRKQTRDGNGQLTRGARGDIMMYCTSCQSNDPLLSISRTADGGVVAHFQRFRGAELWIDEGAIKVRCPPCSSVVELLWDEINAVVAELAVSQDNQRAGDHPR